MASAPDLEIRLLGELSILRDGAPQTLPQSRKTRALLAYLVLNPGPVRRERLCELLWQVPDDPRGSLRWSLSKLRGLVNDPQHTRIVADREHVAFEAAGATVDLLALRQRCQEDVQTLETTALNNLAQALAAGCLEGLELSGQPDFDLFLAEQREQLRIERRKLLLALTQRLAEQPAQLVPLLQQLVEIDPYDFACHLRLIESLAQAGRSSDARRQCTLSQAQFRDVSGVDPLQLEQAVASRPASVAPAIDVAPSMAPGEPSLRQEVRFCRTADQVQIAYAAVGEGPPLVKTANWLNHLEYDWESPVWRHVFGGLAAGRQLIRYDARGNGLSDWQVDDFSIESQVADLETVVDTLGLEQFPLLGISQGCAISVEYAVRHPEKVSKLVLLGGYARGWNKTDSKEYSEKTQAMLKLIELGWGDRHNVAFRQMFTSLFMPSAPKENQDWFNELQRKTTSADNAARLLRALGEVDVRSRLPLVQAPTLVLHARHDMRVPYTAGRELAGGIPGARFVTLHSSNHLLPEGDPAWSQLLSEVNNFLAES